MSEKPQARKPQTFRLDDPAVIVVDQDEAGRPARGIVQITPEAEPALPVPLEAPIRERRGLAYTANGSGHAHIGTNEAARADAIQRVSAWFAH